jgi:NIMA (never in mitosis gene a)-related kinase
LKILHRDLKSANIFLFSDGTAKIGDLNVSKVAKKGLGYTQTGTPYYASPEVWRDEPYDSKSDIWSLACVTYEMLTLHPPFRAESMKGLYEKVIKGKYPKISEKYSSDISELLKLLFKLNPKDRPSCGDILKNPIVVKRMEFLKSGADNDIDIVNMDEAALLRTIRIPKNIIFLSNKLPKANYESSSDPNISTAENTKDVKNNYSNNNIVLPTLNNKINYRYVNSESAEENNTNEMKKKNLNVITENEIPNNKKIGILHENSKGAIKSPIRNISPSSLNKIPNSEIRISNQIRRQKKALAPINNKQKNVILNKGLSALYKLYISNDYRNSALKNGNNIGLYLPNVYRRNANGIRSNSNSYLSPNGINSKKIASKKRLSPINIKIQ